MLTGRRRAEWSRVCYAIAWQVKVTTGAVIDPDAINPYADTTRREARPKSASQIEIEDRVSWKALDRFFAG